MQAATSDHQFLSRAADIEHVLRERVALLPGVRDRENRPIIFVPARDVSTHQDHLRNLLIYLYDVTADDAKTRGFTFVFDMRRGTSWEIVKPILKFLQEYFPVHINCVYILRPEKFFEKYKISTSKYNKFGVNMISLEELPKHIDFCQIIREFGGSMRYDHDEWIEIRKDIERIVHRMSEILKNLERMAAEMGNAEMPVDVPTAKTANARHQELYPIIAAVPTDEFESEINQLKNRVLSSGNQLNGMHKGLQNGSLSISPNPDLISVFPHLSQLLHTLMKTRTDVWYKWDSRKNDLDRYAQLKLFEQDAEELSRWICSQFERLTHQFVLIGESELESNRLLKEHKDFADAVNKIEVSYKQVLTVGHRLMQQFQTHGMNRIENISQQLKSDWTQFVSRIDQRTQLLQLALNAHRKCNAFLRNAKNWLMNVGVDPSSIKSQEELPTAAKKHHDFQKLFQTAYTEAFEETNELAKALRRLYRDAVEQLPAYQLVQTQIQEITRTNREIHGIWESRNQTINIKAQSTVFISDLKSVLNWLTDHGEPFMRRKIGIGVDRHSSSVLCETHNKFRYVAINTHKNAEQIFALAGQLRDSDDSLDPNVFLLVEELRRRSDKFRKCIDQRTNLLCVAHYFFLHYEEIMAWYQKMEERMDYIRIVPETVEQGEQNKEKFHTENQCTKSAYDRVMFEAQQLLQSLAHQRELLDVDNTETTVHVQTLIRDIENQHQKEKTCWQDQRTYLNVATMICTFLRDCDELNKQLVSWRHDLLSLRNSVSTNVEVTKQFHTQNTVKVQQVVFDAMKLLSDILREIESKSLHFIYAADPNQPIKGVLTASAKQLQNLEMEVMNIAKDVSNCIELNMQLTRLRHIANEVIQSIERQQMRLMQESLYRIPGSHQELDIQTRDFQEFRVEIEATEMDVRHFYEEKDRFTNLPVTALESQAETRMRAENLCSEVRMKWQNLVGLVEGRNKLISAAGSYYKYTKLVIPTSQSIERDLLVEKESDFCQSADWGSLERCFEAINERIEKQSSHKERFMEASVYAQRTADVFIRQIRRCEAPREHIESKLCEVQEYKDVARERQTYIFRLWMECNAQLEQCRDAVKIQLMAKEIIDWADREMATCVKIIAHLDQIKKSGEVGERRAKLLEALLERCLEQSDLIKVQRYELRKMVQEGRRFLSERSGDQHAAEINRVLNAAPIRFKNIWDMLSECEQAVRAALSSGSNNDLLSRKSVEQSFSLDRYSDSTIEDKLRAEANKEQSGDGDVVNKKIMEPMRELIKSERDYIEDMRRCVDVYLYAYKTAGSMCPMELRAKERQIFGNIEELYQFHSSIFLNELMAYEQNPEDVGYCFIEWMEKLKELYADYCLNKEENSALVCHPDAIKMFNEIRVQNELDLCHDLQSLVIKPVQRITKYHILLKELLKHSKKNSKEIKNAYDIVLSIPKLANDRMHLKSFENHQEYAIGDFVMQDIFLVSEPKRYFKRERELQVFLFESNIVFAKREELSSRKINYAYKDSMLLREVHVVEHIEGDNTKFGLRKSAFPHQNDQNTTVLKANSESVRMYWVRTLRDLKLDMGRQKMSIDERPPSFVSGSSTNRASRDSQSSLIAMSVAGQSAPEDRNSVQSVESNNNNSLSTPQVVLRARESTPTAGQTDKFTVAEDFTANGPDQLSVRSGQQIRVLPSQPGADPPSGRGADYVKVSLAEDAERPQRSGYVPRCILVADTDSPGTSSQSQEEIQAQSLATSTGNKRTSIRRFFSSNQSAKSGSNRHSSSNANCTAADQPSCSADLSQQHSATASDLPDPSSVLSSVQPPSTTASATLAQSFGTTAARGSSDLDLPPPMSQLGSAAAVGAEHTNNVDDTSELTNEVQPNMESTTPTAAGEEPSSSSAPNAVNTPVEAMSAEDSAKLKRSYVLQELVESERTYVQDLASIVEGYIGSLREMELGDEDREKIKIIFANIEQILDFHRTFFLKEIEKSLVSHDAAGNAFIKYERRLHTFYVKYCQNKPKSDFLVGQDNFEQLLLEIKEKLGHKVALSDLLIKPVQRITKYQLMLNDILKYTHRAKDNADVLERAHDIMRVVPKACDDMMQVGRLQGFQGNLNAQGRLIFQGTLCISDGGTAQPFKGKERRVFLFEQSVIIAECIPPRKEYGNPTYNFKHQIMVNKMMLDDKLPEEPLRFVLQSNDPNQQATYVVQAASAEDKEQWLNKLSAQLDQQKTFLAALVDPKRYQNQLANSMGSLNLGGKKDSSGSLGTPTSPAPSSATSPTKPQGQKSGSKLFGFGKPK